jgi:hypothetical protein
VKIVRARTVLVRSDRIAGLLAAMIAADVPVAISRASGRLEPSATRVAAMMTVAARRRVAIATTGLRAAIGRHVMIVRRAISGAVVAALVERVGRRRSNVFRAPRMKGANGRNAANA